MQIYNLYRLKHVTGTVFLWLTCPKGNHTAQPPKTTPIAIGRWWDMCWNHAVTVWSSGEPVLLFVSLELSAAVCDTEMSARLTLDWQAAGPVRSSSRQRLVLAHQNRLWTSREAGYRDSTYAGARSNGYLFGARENSDRTGRCCGREVKTQDLYRQRGPVVESAVVLMIALDNGQRSIYGCRWNDF